MGRAHNLEALKNLSAKITIVEQENLEDGMAGALLSSEKAIGSEPFLLVSTNDIVGEDCHKMIKNFVQKNSEDSALIGFKVSEYFPGGYLTVENNQITGIIEKPGEGNEPGNLVNIVVHFHRHSQKLFQALKEASSSHDDRYEIALDSLFKQNLVYRALEFKGFWQPIKYPWHILRASEYFLSTIKKSISKKAKISKTAIIQGNVVIADGVRVFDNAVIQGPAYIGQESVIATGALVRNSMLGERCVAGYTTEIARSYLANDVWTHKNYLGDSIIDSNCSFGSGAVTGNLRLDEEEISVAIKDQKIKTGTEKLGLICGRNIRCGINVSFMPGIKVGSNSLIGAGISIAQDIPEKSYVTGDWNLKIRENNKKVNSREEQMKKLKD